MANLNLYVIRGETQLAEGMYERIAPILNSEGVSEVLHPEDADYRLGLGGDGTAIGVARQDLENPNLPPVFGVKAGNPESKGMFLNDIELAGGVEHLVELIERSVLERLWYLEVEVENISGRVERVFSLNDVSTIRSKAQSAATRVSVNGVVRANRVLGDGFIVSTPQGSTAYNLNAHGVVANSTDTIQVAASNARYRPFVLKKRDTLELRPLELRKRPQRLETDGRIVSEEFQRLVAKMSDKSSVFAFVPGQGLEDKLFGELSG